MEAFPGDDVSFPLGLGEVINVNQRFDPHANVLAVFVREPLHWLRERPANGGSAKLGGGIGTTVYRNSCPRLRLSLYPCQQSLETLPVIYGLLPTIFDRLKGHTAPHIVRHRIRRRR